MNMTDSILKTSHKEWRREAKKARRKRIRQRLAEQRKEQEKVRENSPTYLLQIEKKRLYEEYEREKEEKEREERNLKWLEEEVRAQKQWREEQKLKQLAEEEKLKELERIRKEWEKEQAKIREQKERLEALKKEEEKRRQDVLDKINEFISDGGDIPLELQVVIESNPGKEICSFYQKVGACRFGSQCSRNHHYYKISNTLMVTNFYSHFTLDQNKSSEYDTDISLEYEDTDMYSHFKDFYNDIVPEFKRFGDVSMIKVCCNTESHLRGNVYVEYKNEREALIAYKAFQGRWYGGKQLNIEFVKIRDWGGAVCGDFARRRCPKGKSCNFLHVFKNPKNEFAIDWNKNRNTNSVVNDSFDDVRERSERRSRSWRWSETPELSPNRSSRSSKENHMTERRSKSSERRKESKSSERKNKSGNSERKNRSGSSERKNKSDRSERRKRSGSSERRSKTDSSEKRKKSGSSERNHKSDSSEKRKRSNSSERKHRSSSAEKEKTNNYKRKK